MESTLIDNRQIRVFISSTFNDMQAERDYLMKRTFPILKKKAEERDVTITELDLRWGITEEEANSGKVVDICLREIENSIPFFIGIIGNRYGWIPSKEDIDENVTQRFENINRYIDEGLSVTEIEMQFGVLDRTEDMHAFFYIKSQEEESDNHEMIVRLKEKVKSSRYPHQYYTSIEELASQVENNFTELLDELFPEGEQSKKDKERIGQRSFLNKLCQNYIRNDADFDVINSWVSDQNQKHLVITGASGLGKSALLANWTKEQLNNPDRDYNIIYFFVGNGGCENEQEEIVRYLTECIKDLYSIQDDDDLESLFKKVATRKPLIIVLDAVNQVANYYDAKTLYWIPSPPKNIKFIYSTLEDDETMHVFEQKNYQKYVLQPLSEENRRMLVVNYLKLFGKRLTEKQITRIVTDEQCENTLVLKTLLDELINFGDYGKLDDRIELFIQDDTIEAFYQRLLGTYEDEFTKEFVSHALMLIVLARFGLSENELISILGVPHLKWSQFYCVIKNHLVSKGANIDFAHKYIYNAVADRYYENDKQIKNLRKEIIKYFSPLSTHRAWEETSYQLYYSNELAKLHKYLMNIDIFNYLCNYDSGMIARYWGKLSRRKGYSLSEYFTIVENASQEDRFKTLSLVCDLSRRNFIETNLTVNMALSCLTYANPENNEQLFTAYNGIGEAYDIVGHFPEAMKYYNKALGIEGIDLKKRFDTQVQIGKSSYRYGEYEDAVEAYDTALSTLGSLGTDTEYSRAVIKNNLGLVYNDIGDYLTAIEKFTEALREEKRLLPKDDPEIATTLNNIGLSYRYLGQYDKAVESFKESMAINESTYGDNDIHLFLMYTNLGTTYTDLGKFDEALSYQKKALKICLDTYGEDNENTATAYNNIALIYSSNFDGETALNYHEKARIIYEKVLSPNHPKLGIVYGNIGMDHWVLSDYKKAEFYLKKAIRHRKSNHDKEDLDSALTYNNLGLIHIENGELKKALGQFFKAIEILEGLSSNHPQTAQILSNIGYTYYLNKEFEKALVFAKDSLERYEKLNNKESIKDQKNLIRDIMKEMKSRHK